MFRQVKRQKQALTIDRCKDILSTSLRGVLAVIGDGGYPYTIPLNHYFSGDGCLYFHSGRVGHKIDAIKSCNKVSYSVITDPTTKDDSWVKVFESVVVFGTIEIIEDVALTEKITRELSLKFTDDINYIDNEIKHFLGATILLKLTPEHITGKVVEES